MQTRKINSFLIFYFSFFLLSSLIFNFSSCKKSTEPVYNPQNLQLQVLEVSCTEAWLSLQAKSDYLNKTLKLFQNDSLKLEKPLTAEDSILVVEELWPNTSYQFKAEVYDGEKLLAKSAKVTAATMDTTSHDFTWQTFEFGGEGGSSSFYDVAIIDENDIWAVGEIYTANDKYNAAHWDGEKWELKKIANDSYPRRVVYAFGKNDVWFDGTIKWDGSRYTVHNKNFPLLPNGDGWYENAMWGTSSEDFYLVGDHGMIAHYDGQQWQRIESGTDYDIHDIWGDINFHTGKLEILALASQMYYGRGLTLIRIIGKTITHLDTTGLRIAEQSVWFKAGKDYYITGDGVFRAQHPYCEKADWQYLSGHPKLWKSNIRGSDVNDIFVVGAYGLVSHFNGLSWKHYTNDELPTFYGEFTSVKIKNNFVVIVGYKNELAYLLKGVKNK